MTEDDRRLVLVRELLEFSKPVDEVARNLAQFSWDFEATGVVLTRKHIANVLRRFLNRELTSDQVVDWANAVEGRDDVEYSADQDQILSQSVFELANPLLTERLSDERAIELLNILE